MSWNYRILFHPAGVKKFDEDYEIPYEAYYGLHEVYYRDGKPWVYTEDPVVVVDVPEEFHDVNEVHDEFESVLEDMKRGVNLPILKEDDFRTNKKDGDGKV